MTPEQQPAFRFPVCYEEEGQFLLRTGNDVETVVLLSNRNSSEMNHIKVNVDMEDTLLFLSDVIVDPQYQGQGIGKTLVNSCIRKIKEDMKPGYKVKLNLMAAKGKEPFYEKFGFEERPNNNLGAGMDQWFVLEDGEK